MPRMSPADYLNWLAKHPQGGSKAPADAVSREVEELHAPILEWCRNQKPMVPVIHSRTDKASSVTVGAPDFVILWQGKALFIECKAKTGKLSYDQTIWAYLAEKHGFKVHLVRSMSEFRALVEPTTQTEAK